MLNIEVELDKIFNYERNENGLIKSMINSPGNFKATHLDRRFENKSFGVYGTCPILFDDSKGTQLVYYTAERNFHKEGPVLPARFRSLMDCPYVHFGVLLNCLAYLSGRNVSKLTLCRVASESKMESMKVRPEIAELFLSNISHNALNRELHEAQPQFALFY